MKPFNLEEAKAGKLVCNRAGEDVRIICFDRKSDFNNLIVALHTNDGAEDLFSHKIDGKYGGSCSISKLDLFMQDENKKKKEGWTNIYKYMDSNKICSSFVYPTYSDAYTNRNASGYITTAKIEWEE